MVDYFIGVDQKIREQNEIKIMFLGEGETTRSHIKFKFGIMGFKSTRDAILGL